MQHISGLCSNSQEQTPAIKITTLSKSYLRRKSTIKAVDNLNLSIPKGQVFGFLGSNGAGKTTTIKMICGLILPTEGEVQVNGYTVAREHSMAMQQLGAVLEGTRNVYWRLSAWENLMYFGRLRGYHGKKLAIRAEQLLRELDLWDRRKDLVRTFSRGMQQKVAIACSLITDPPIVLLDEPTLGLDIQASRTVKEWIARLAREQNKTVVLTTHQLDIAQELCDRIAIMSHGQLLTDKPLNELLSVFQQEYYHIRIKGTVESHWHSCFDGLTIESENGETLLIGPIVDQSTLHRYIDEVHRLNLPLLSINRVEPNLEDIFVHLTKGGEERSALQTLAVS